MFNSGVCADGNRSHGVLQALQRSVHTKRQSFIGALHTAGPGINNDMLAVHLQAQQVLLQGLPSMLSHGRQGNGQSSQ